MKHFRAKGRTVRRVPGQMNKTEAAYAERLRADTSLAMFRFEPIKLRLADNTYFSPDFMVIAADGQVELHEVKVEKADGSVLMEDDAAVKIKVAAEIYDEFVFKLCSRATKKNGGGWTIKVVGPDRN